MRILVTAGPTREHLDDVRFLSSGSTGRMGIEVALAATARGHDAVLVLGPTHVEVPDDDHLDLRNIVSARDMLAACLDEWPNCDALVATAAVADYRPAERHDGKRPKSYGPMTLDLERNPDVLATLSAEKGDRPVIGFALQVEEAEARAREKMEGKDLDAIVLDGPDALGAEICDFVLMERGGAVRRLEATSKADLAADIIRLIETLRV